MNKDQFIPVCLQCARSEVCIKATHIENYWLGGGCKDYLEREINNKPQD